MKALVLTGVLFLASAAVATAPEAPEGSKVSYESWCEGDKVTTWDDGDLPITQWDCYDMTDKGLCVETAEKEGDLTVITASCK